MDYLAVRYKHHHELFLVDVSDEYNEISPKRSRTEIRNMILVKRFETREEALQYIDNINIVNNLLDNI